MTDNSLPPSENPRNWQRRNSLVVPESAWLGRFLNKIFGHVEHFDIAKMGGLVNSNFRVNCDGRTFFLRICNGDPASANKEFALREKMPSHLPIAKIIACDAYLGLPVLLFEWLDGDTLKNRFHQFDKNASEKVAYALGTLLGEFSKIEYSCHGFIGASGEIEMEFNMDERNFKEYVSNAVAVVENQIGSRHACRIRDFVHENAFLMNSWPQTGHLVHGDFHADNILLNGDFEVTGIVDWECAMAWQGTHDIAHLLRRQIPHREFFEQKLVQGYKDHGGWIPDEWERSIRLLQLLGWIDKLAGGERRPEVIRDANAAIEEVLS